MHPCVDMISSSTIPWPSFHYCNTTTPPPPPPSFTPSTPTSINNPSIHELLLFDHHQASTPHDSTREDKKIRRIISNRESARRSRMRKQRQLHDMQSQVAHLRGLNRQLFDQLNLAVHGRDRIIAENAYLKEELSLLQLQLKGLEEEKKSGSTSTSLLIRNLLEDPCNQARF